MRYFFDDFSLDNERRELCRGTEVIAIAPKVFDLLGYLIGNRERVVSKDDLISSHLARPRRLGCRSDYLPQCGAEGDR